MLAAMRIEKQKIETWQTEDAARLKRLFKEKSELSQEEFGAKYDIGSQGMVWQYLNGRSPLNLAAAIKFASGLKVKISDFSPTLARELEPVSKEDLLNESNITLAKIGDRRIPLIDYVQAGKWTEVVNSNQLSNASDWLLTDLDLSDNAFALEIKGESMLPRFKEGDRIIVDPTVHPLPGDFVVAKNGEHEATFKKYRPRGISEQGTQVFELVPLNEDFATLRSDICQITIIGTMVEHRSYRKK